MNTVNITDAENITIFSGSFSPTNAAPADERHLVDSPVYSPMESMFLGSQMLNHKIGQILEIYYSPAIITTGLIGNFLSAIVMFQKDSLKISCYFYMAVLSVVDSIPLGLMLGYWFIKEAFPQIIPLDQHQTMCSILWYLAASSTCLGSYLVVFMTFDRLVAVKYPMKSITWCTMERARITTIICVIVCVVFNLPYVWYTKAAPPLLCLAFQVKQNIFVNLYYWVATAIFNYLPFILLLSFNTMIIITLKKRGKYFKKDRESDNSSTNNATVSTKVSEIATETTPATKQAEIKNQEKTQKARAITGKPKQKSQKSDLSLTVMLLFVTFSYLILTSPLLVFYVVYMKISYLDTPKSWADYILFGYTASKLFQTNHAINFYLYCIGGAKFRTDLRKTFIKIYTCLKCK